MILCKPSGRIMTEKQYAEIYHKVRAEREKYWAKRNAASPYHPRLGS